MTNRQFYRFDDFLLTNYYRLLMLAKENYKFGDYSRHEKSKLIILRHDIEFSIPIALRMARLENELGISASYFVQVHSEFYNPLDKGNFDALMEIIGLGHNVGLHFDSHFWGINSETELEKYLNADRALLENYFGNEIKAFSFHNTNKFVLSCEKEYYAGLINVYSRIFKENYGYCADSTGYWRYERLEDRLREANDEKLQILIHDGMWQDVVLPPRQRVFKVIDDRSDYLKSYYDATLKKFGAKNIDWDECY